MQTQIAIQDNRQEFINMIKNSLFPDKPLNMVSIYISYCEALKLDPIMKHAHIAQIAGKDVILPGIGLYRIMAHRSGVYLGLSAPEFGPTIKRKFDGTEIEYPEWCLITAYKQILGEKIEFPGYVRWTEACQMYKGNPTQMWIKRPFGQLEKCAEALALRRAFSEMVPQQPTFEEMEGQDYIDLNAYSVSNVKNEPIKPKSLQEFKEKITKKENIEENENICIEQEESSKNLSDSNVQDGNTYPAISDEKSAILGDIAQMLSYYEDDARLGLEKAILKKLQVSHFQAATEDKLEKAYKWLVDKWVNGSEKQGVAKND